VLLAFIFLGGGNAIATTDWFGSQNISQYGSYSACQGGIFLCGSSGTATDLYYYGSSPNAQSMALYNVSGWCGTTKIVESASIKSQSSVGWHDFPISPTAVSGGTYYLIAVHPADKLYRTTEGHNAYNSASSFPSNWQSGTYQCTGTIKWAMYCVYTLPSGPANVATIDAVLKASISTLDGVTWSTVTTLDGIN